MINAHTHIFTIDHVPNKFAKGMLPIGLAHVFTIRFIKRLWPFVLRIRKFYRWYQLKVGNVLLLKLVFWLISWVLKRLGIGVKLTLPGPEALSMYRRYLRLADYAFSLDQNKLKFNKQKDVFERLQLYYGEGTLFVVLTMDMEFMEGGKPIEAFDIQLKEMEDLKAGPHQKHISPFLCVDPRRLSLGQDNGGWTYDQYFEKLAQPVSAEDPEYCYGGIKLYPALGFYPFDWRLLPIYQKAIENNIPIMTHCAHGPVYYRGSWKKEVHGVHPFSGMELPKKAFKGPEVVTFTVNFTHPLNYAILTDSKYLHHYLNHGVNPEGLSTYDRALWDQHVQPLTENTPDLSQLKICLAHWGGGDEWDRYLENHELPGLDIPDPLSQLDNPEYFERIWKEYSWFYLIRSMVSDPNKQLYTDISFTLNEEKYLNMLKVQLTNDQLREKILFGTDYYVVSHMETEREFSVDVRGALGEKDWDQLSDVNPKKYLERK